MVVATAVVDSLVPTQHQRQQHAQKGPHAPQQEFARSDPGTIPYRFEKHQFPGEQLQQQDNLPQPGQPKLLTESDEDLLDLFLDEHST